MIAASDKPTVLLVGVSTRAMCQSAVNAGYGVISLDYFADSDQPASVEKYSLARDFHLPLSISNLITAARELLPKVQVVIPCVGLESFQGLVTDPKITVWGNDPHAAALVRDFSILKKILPGTGVQIPLTLTSENDLPKNGRWLVKDLTHNGGTGVSRWRPGGQCRSTEIIQEYFDGDLCSAAFLADGRQARLMGLTRQYSGRKEVGAKGFLWCGNAAPLIDKGLFTNIENAANELTSFCGLRGWNGIDFIVRQGIPYLIEVNPRWSGSIELFERVYGFNAFDMHRQSCEGSLPMYSMDVLDRFWAKGIVYSRKKLMIKDPAQWPKALYADIPHPGEVILHGYPVCTILAESETLDASWQAVLTGVSRLEKELYLG